MTEQGTIYIQGWSNGVQELSNFSDIYVSCKYGWKDTSLGTVTQTGTITNKSLTVADSFDFITFEGDSHTITATWDDEQYIGVVPVIYDVILTYSGSSPKLNKLSFDPTNDGWTILGDCETVDQGINSGYAIEFSNPQKEIHVETQTDKKAWSTTEPYFGTGVIADGAYYNGVYVIIDGTNHPGELSFSSTDSWESSDTKKYSKQTSGSMFYMWDSGDITECSGLNHYTWNLSDVYLCYDNTTTLTVDGITYTKQNPGPSQPDLTGRYYFNSQEETILYFNSSNSLEFGSCSGGTVTYTYEWLYTDHWVLRLNDGVEDYDVDYDENDDVFEYNGAEFTYSSTNPCGGSAPYSVEIITSGQGTVDGIHSGDQTGQYYLTAIPAQGWTFDHWSISGWDTQDNPLDSSFPNAHQTVYVYFIQEGPGPQPTEKHIYLCDNSGAHLAEMTNTGSTWSVSGAFTSGMYSIRATVEDQYEDAWFKFYQTSDDNRIFVGAGDDPIFEDIGTYIVIDDILTSFSLVEDQTTNYYVVSYENTGAITTSMVETIINNYTTEQGFVTGSDIATMSYITMADVSARSYVNIADLNAMSYVSQTALSAMGYVTAGEIPTPDLTNCVKYADLNVYAYVSQPALSAMSYVDNSYLSTYMNNVVGNIESILQTI